MLRAEGRLLAALAALDELQAIVGTREQRQLRLELSTQLGLREKARIVALQILQAPSDDHERQAATAALQTLDSLEQGRRGADLEQSRRDLLQADEMLARGENARAAALYSDAWRRSYPNPVALVMAGLALQHAGDDVGARILLARALVDAESAAGSQAALDTLTDVRGITDLGETPPQEGACPNPPGYLLNTTWQGNQLVWLHARTRRRLFAGGDGHAILHLDGEPAFLESERAQERATYWRKHSVPSVAVRSWRDDVMTLCSPATNQDLGRIRHPIEVFDFNEGYRGALQFSEDRRWLAAGANDGILRVWDTSSLHLVRSYSTTPKLGSIHLVGVSSGKRYVAAADLSTVAVWETASGKLVDHWSPPTSYLSHYGAGWPLPISALTFAGDESEYAVLFTRSLARRLLNKSKHPNIGTFLTRAPNWLWPELAMSNDGAVALGGGQGIGALLLEDSAIEDLPAIPVFSPDGDHAFAASPSRIGLLVHDRQWHPIQPVSAPGADAYVAANRMLLRGTTQSVVLRLPDLAWDDGGTHEAGLAALTPDGLSLVSVRAEGQVIVQQLDPPKSSVTAQHADAPTHPTGLLAASAGLFAITESTHTRLWQVDGAWMRTLRVPGRAMRLSRDGTRVAVSNKNDVEILSTADGKRIHQLEGDHIRLASSTRHAVLQDDKVWYLVDLDTEERTALPPLQHQPTFSSDSRWLVGQDKSSPRTFLLWPLDPGDTTELVRFTSECGSPLVNANRALLVCDKQLKVWSLRPLVEMQSLAKASRHVGIPLLSDDARYLLGRDELHTTVWDIDQNRFLGSVTLVAGANAAIVERGNQITLLGPEAEKGELVLGCRAGPYTLPFAACRDRFVRWD